MFGVYNGTAVDVSLLIDHVGSYIAEDFPGVMPEIGRNLVLGVSLGGHAAWQVLFAEPRVEAGVVVIGCPDYIRWFPYPVSYSLVLSRDQVIYRSRKEAN